MDTKNIPVVENEDIVRWWGNLSFDERKRLTTYGMVRYAAEMQPWMIIRVYGQRHFGKGEMFKVRYKEMATFKGYS